MYFFFHLVFNIFVYIASLIDLTIGCKGSTGDFFACPDCTGVPATVSGALRGMHSQKTRQTAEDPGPERE